MPQQTNPYALYVNCDGAMDYDSKNHGGVGFIIRFPEFIDLEDISISLGTYTGANIERMEIEALTQAMLKVIDVYKENSIALKNIKPIIFITDRFGLSDTERMNPFRIQAWRKNKWKSHDGKPIKNHELIDRLDKTRKKLSDLTFSRVHIEFRPRKQNKIADKLAKLGKKDGLINRTLSKKSEKIGKRRFDGQEISYKLFKESQEIHIHVFRKDPVQEEWEVWAELCAGFNKGQKLKIYADDGLASKLQRGNEYSVRLKKVHRYHAEIFRTMKKIKRDA